jgi:hypothetical protein
MKQKSIAIYMKKNGNFQQKTCKEPTSIFTPQLKHYIIVAGKKSAKKNPAFLYIHLKKSWLFTRNFTKRPQIHFFRTRRQFYIRKCSDDRVGISWEFIYFFIHQQAIAQMITLKINLQ